MPTALSARDRMQRTHWKCVPTTASARNGRIGNASLPPRPPHAIWAWRNWLLISPTTTTFARARFFHFLRLPPHRSRRRRAPTSEPLGRDASHPSSDIASQCSLRSGDMTRPCETDALERRPYHAPRPPHETDALEMRPYQRPPT